MLHFRCYLVFQFICLQPNFYGGICSVSAELWNFNGRIHPLWCMHLYAKCLVPLIGCCIVLADLNVNIAPIAVSDFFFFVDIWALCKRIQVCPISSSNAPKLKTSLGGAVTSKHVFLGEFNAMVVVTTLIKWVLSNHWINKPGLSSWSRKW